MADEGWKHLLTIKDLENISKDNIVVNIGASYKYKGYATLITAYPFGPGQLEDETSFSYTPLYIESIYATDLGIKGGFLTFEDIIINMPIILKHVFGIDASLSMKGITEITEEEFYKMD